MSSINVKVPSYPGAREAFEAHYAERGTIVNHECLHCRWFESFDNDKTGECHYNPPIAKWNGFPVVKFDDYCREWEDL